MKTLLLTGMATSLWMNVSAEERVDGRYMNDFFMERRTPSREFANPAAWGAPSVLFLVPMRQSYSREVAELLQRMDLRATVVTAYDPLALDDPRKDNDGRWPEEIDRYTDHVKGARPAEKEAELLEALQHERGFVRVYHSGRFGVPRGRGMWRHPHAACCKLVGMPPLVSISSVHLLLLP